MLGLPSLLVGTGPLPPKALASLPPSASLPTGTQYEITDYGKNVAIVINGVWRFVAPFRTTWANRPAAALVSPGTELQATDYANQKWICDGTVWQPAQGRAVIGSSVTPSVVTGAADMMFTLAAAAKKIPVGMVIPGSRLICSADFIKSGANGTFTPYIRFGTTDTYADTSIYGVGHANTNNLLVRASSHVLVGYDGSFVYATSAVVSPGAGTQYQQIPVNFNINADMFMSVHIRGANAADSFMLKSTSIVLEA